MKLVTKTRSVVPLVLGIIGGVFGIIGGLCYGVLSDVVNEAAKTLGVEINNLGLAAAGGYLLLFASIAGLVGGCIARSKKAGCLIQLASGIACVICFVLMWIGWGVFPGWPGLIPITLFLIGSLVGMAYPKKEVTEEIAVSPTDGN